MTQRIIVGDVRRVLADLDAASVQTCVTSPPYFGLRDYGVDGQIGLEPTVEAYVETMVAVFREVWRVLRDDGTLWLNLGDSYYGSNKNDERRAKDSPGVTRPSLEKTCERCGHQFVGGPGRRFCSSYCGGIDNSRRSERPGGIKPKDLIGIPWRVAFALQAAGWYLRSDVIWSKLNPMPESVTDRPTRAHEYLFLLTKRPRYYYDADAVREPSVPDSDARYQRSRYAGNKHGADRVMIGYAEGDKTHLIGTGRNIRSVWTIATQPFPEAHFATFPPKLVEPCIKAGSKPGDTVLDPFAGAGTTLLVADRLGRNGIGVELNPEYAVIAQRRISNDAPMFAVTELETA